MEYRLAAEFIGTLIMIILVFEVFRLKKYVKIYKNLSNQWQSMYENK